MFLMHPVSLVSSLFSSLCYAIYLSGAKAVRTSLLFTLPMMLVAALVNPAFNHEGATILTYLPTGNPLTLESIVYGFATALMLCALVVWFTCFSHVMTSDKLVYLFGRIIPALSLVVSMTLRFVPKFKAQFKVVADAQRCVGRDTEGGKLVQRLKNAITVFSIMVTWSLENGIETADSMKSRGYGLPGRSAFSIYTFDSRDKLAALWLGFCAVFLLSGALTGGFAWQYYPMMKGAEVTPMVIALHVVYCLLGLTPVWLQWQEEQVWKRINEEAEP